MSKQTAMKEPRTAIDVEGIVWTEIPEDGWWMGECGCIATSFEEIARKHGPARLVTIEVAEVTR